MKLTTVALAVALAFAASAGAQEAKKEKPKKFPPIAITAVKAAAAPTVDGDASDAIWKTAPVHKLKAVKGANFATKAKPNGKNDEGETTVNLQVAYTSDMIYLLVSYDDPTYSVRRAPYVKQADGTWQKLKDPDDKGGDNNKYYEDKMGILWNLSVAGFNEGYSCQIACHTGEKGKPYGNKYTEEEGELTDMWHFKYVRTGPLDQNDDGYVDHTRFEPEKAKNAGRKTDAKTGGGYDDIKLVDGKPEFMAKDAKAANKGGTYWLKAEDKVPFDNAKFKAGDEVASIMISPFVGDRADVKTVAKWKNGKWTLEFSRKLVTGSKTDVNFSDLAKTYGFGIAVFDNAQVRHAYVQEPLMLSFK